MSRRKTHEEFVREISVKNPRVKVLGTYVKASQPVLVGCLRCGYEWKARPSNLLGSRNKAPSGCPKCANNILGSTEDFIQEMAEINSSLTILGEYKGNKAKIRVLFNKCGYIWNPTPNSLRLGHGCPDCSHKRAGRAARLTHEEFVQRVAVVNPNVEVLGQYKTAQDKVCVQCKACNHIWDVAPFNLLNGSGCPSCAKSGTSYMQQFILGAFRAVLGNESVLARDTNAVGSELDVYIPSLHLAIEPGGWNWHKDIIERDKKKRDLCDKSGIRLITVYDAYDRDEKPFATDCYTFQIDLGAEPGHTTLRTLAMQLFEDAGIESDCLTDDDWIRVNDFARNSSRRITTEQFAEQLRGINPDIEVLGEYINYNARIRVRSRKCGHIFSAAPATLLRGQGCPECRYLKTAESLRKERGTFISELAIIAPTLEVIGEYRGTHKPIDVRCRKCGYEWAPTPHNLLNGHGCPRCAGCERMNTDAFKQRIRELSPTILILGEYVNNTTPLLCKCIVCNTEWKTTPKSLKRGSGCPECTKQRIADGHRLTAEAYCARLRAKTDNIELLSKFEGMNSKLKARCKVCGEEWEVTAGELLHRAYLRHLHNEG